MPVSNRRDFLKIASILPASALISSLLPKAVSSMAQGTGEGPKIVILLFDAMSARNLSVYGYHRKTTPNLERFAERATVFHSHYAGGNFTIPGTASLLTGTYPWTHRAINDGGLVARNLTSHNMFNAFGKDINRIAFGQNVWASFILSQFKDDIDQLFQPGAFGGLSYLVGSKFPDENLAYRAFDDFAFDVTQPSPSLLLGNMQKYLFYHDTKVLEAQSKDYPRGVPRNINYALDFRLDFLFSGMLNLVEGLSASHIAYLHILPPHAPYRPTKKFYGKFTGNWHPEPKPRNRLSVGASNATINDARLNYDEYIASADDEFGRFFDKLERSGLLDNSYLIVTSDHGEMLERGEIHHSTPLLYDPVVHVPLLISAPGQRSRKDVHAFTNAVDVLPTLVSLAGKNAPDWCEGALLPEFGGIVDPQRSTFTVEAKLSNAFAPLSVATVAMRKEPYKLIYYTGYEKEDSFELYNLVDDIEELDDLYPRQPAIAKAMKEELLDRFHQANKPYQH